MIGVKLVLWSTIDKFITKLMFILINMDYLLSMI